MPHLWSADNGESSQNASGRRARSINEHRSMWNRLSFQKIGHWLKRDDAELAPPAPPAKPQEEPKKETERPHSSAGLLSSGGLLSRRGSRKVVPGLPRPLTFKRMQSEKRDKLLEVPDEMEQRRAISTERRPTPFPPTRNLTPPPISAPSVSAPDILTPHATHESVPKRLPERGPTPTIGGGPDSNIPAGAKQVDYGADESVDYMSAGEPQPPMLDLVDSFSERGSQRSVSDIDDVRLQEEMEARWILNLSMHFRDMSDREKFFLTYAEEPNKWRRVTVSCDYRQLEPDSLEADLKTLHYQRDKSSRIYEAIRESLGGIQFYDTVTNLKLQTTDGRLHVHVTEDVNEIIPYPATTAIEHLDCQRFRETSICFDSHISGFVYKVSVNNKSLIKKEIPGPDAVEEFLYEINALCSLQDSNSVIKFEGVIIDENNELIKGLLISYADQGALVDMIYDFKPTGQLYWERREKWARQIVEGLSEIHESGYVQGDFTLSNIVIDKNDDAKIIDINRRGCPVGWEPPELAKLIESGQRISIYIGVKSDLYQLGMVLWALAEQQDEPERQERPLTKTMERHRPDIPDYFRKIVRDCMSDLPRNRPQASQLLKRFPKLDLAFEPKPTVASRESVSTHRSDKEYIDPATAVDLNDISIHRRHSRNQSSFENVHVPPTEYPASSGSYILANNDATRGRSPGGEQSGGYRRSDCSPYPGHRSVMSLDDSELENELASLPASRETRWEQIYVDGDTKLVQRGGGDIGVHDFATQEPKGICITTPPGEMDNSFMTNKPTEDAPLSFSSLMPIEPQLAQSNLLAPQDEDHRGVGSKASFSDRVHQLAHAQQSQHPSPESSPKKNRPTIPEPSTLADLEHEVDLSSSVSTSTAPSRVGTGFSIFDLPERARRTDTGFSIASGYRMPPHQDSGFAEPERTSYESEHVRKSLDESIRDLKYSRDEEDSINERLWDENNGTLFGQPVRGRDMRVRPFSKSTPMINLPDTGFGPKDLLSASKADSKALEEKNSNTTIRPPSIQIPEFHHGKVATANTQNQPLTPPKSGALQQEYNTNTNININTNTMTGVGGLSYAHDYLSPLRTSSPDMRNYGASSDLSDYLDHEIAFDHDDASYRKATKRRR
jgi:serine/threonine protein kinase